MDIGIVGVGVIGYACKQGFEKLGHKITCHDLIYNTKLQDLKNTDALFICVSTPRNENGSCDLSGVETTVHNLKKMEYEGLVVIKSTVKPTTTERLIQETGLNISFVPEFLRERSATEDFIKNHDLLAIGTCSDRAYSTIKTIHGNLPKQHARLLPTEAEILKYYSNTINAMRVVFANSIYEVCDHVNADYNKIKEAFLKRGTINDLYLNINENCRGYAGVCLPQDTGALNAFINELGLDLKIFEAIQTENDKFKKTVFDGMRL
jgi:UDPglucose 6-dehydrogenase